MNENPPPDLPDDSSDDASDPRPIDESGQFTQRVRHQQLSARVPEAVRRGVFASGVLVLSGNHEFILDFLQSVTRPQQVAARVVLPPSIVGNVIGALRRNLDLYTERFGPPPQPPRPAQPQGDPPPVEEIYGQLKISDDEAGGVYANTLMITHGPSEFCLDFITSFYPRSTVTTRVYMAAPQVVRLLQTLAQSLEQFQRKAADQQRRSEDEEGAGERE